MAEIIHDQIVMVEQPAPSTPATGYAALYVKTDGLWYGKDDAGVETQLSNVAGAGGGANEAFVFFSG